MIKSGRYVPMPAIPMPDFAVPNAAPKPVDCVRCCYQKTISEDVHPKIIWMIELLDKAIS